MSENIFVTILEFVIALGLLLFLHELGHFLIARLFKIEVEEFGLGFPPRLVRLFKLGGTEFTLNWIPFGAFVRPKGENDPRVAGGLAAARPWVRLSVLLGGPFMNILTGILLFAVVVTRIGAPDFRTVQIIEVAPQSPAASAGLAAGDIVVSINGEKIDNMQELSSIVQANLGKEITFVYEREGRTSSITIVPRPNPPEGQGALGIVMSNPNRPISIMQAIPYGFLITLEQGRQLLLVPSMLIKGTLSPEEARFVGPKGMFDIYQQARERDLEAETTPPSPTTPPAVNTLWFLAVISVALGITNLLPIPALDGGRILFIIPELLFGRRVAPEYENMVHLIGFAALLLLMFYITTQDILNPIVLP